MTRLTMFLAATAAIGGLSAPAAAQYYPQPYPQQYPQTYPQAYQGQPYGYGQGGYGNQGAVGQIIDQLLGNRYNVNDRGAVSRCANAAMVQASSQYGPARYNNGYGQPYPQQYGYNANMMRVTAITDVQRRQNGLRVSGLLSSGYGQGQGYGYQQGYGDPRYAANGNLTFRCNVDYRGAVTNIRIRPNNGYRQGY